MFFKKKRKVAKELVDLYKSIPDTEYNEEGYVYFANVGLKFETYGKYAIVKDYKGKKGYHLALSLRSDNLVYMPEDYEDFCDYGSIGFLLEMGYFNDIVLPEAENENGIMVKNPDKLEGKTIKVAYRKGYTMLCETCAFDDINVGEIKFVKWNKDENVIRVKLLVGVGVYDVVVGTVALTEDKSFKYESEILAERAKAEAEAQAREPVEELSR